MNAINRDCLCCTLDVTDKFSRLDSRRSVRFLLIFVRSENKKRTTYCFLTVYNNLGIIAIFRFSVINIDWRYQVWKAGVTITDNVRNDSK